MKFTPFEFLLLALATYRLALLAAKELGPYGIFQRFRRTVKREASKKSHLDEGVDCIWCWSVWLAVPIAVSAWFFWENPVYQISVIALALSAVAVILNQAFTKG